MKLSSIFAFIGSAALTLASALLAQDKPHTAEDLRTFAELLNEVADQVEAVEGKNESLKETLASEREHCAETIATLAGVNGELRAENGSLRTELDELRPPELTESKRLVHFQHVGHTITPEDQASLNKYSNGVNGRLIHKSIATQAEGFAPLNRVIDDLYARYGDDTFDVMLHNPGGISEPYPATAAIPAATMRFEQLDEAADAFPKLISTLPAVGETVRSHGGNLLGYIGLPRCDCDAKFAFVPEVDQCSRSELMRFYGPLLEAGCIAIGHDFTSALPQHSRVLAVNFPWLIENGVDPIIEAAPWRDSPWLLGYTAICDDLLWERWIEDGRGFTPEEIEAAGGRAIFLVYSGTPEERYDRTLAHLQQGRTVAVNLAHVARAKGDRPVERIVEAAR